MLTAGSLAAHLAPLTGDAPYPWEGKPTGMAADTLFRTPLTIKQYVPNIGHALSAPKTAVNPTHEQGWGRAPGWQWGWMRKNIPLSFHSLGHGARHLGQLRVEFDVNQGRHGPGMGKWQTGAYHSPGRTGGGLRETFRGTASRTPLRGTLRSPESTYLTSAVQPQATRTFPTMAWGEPNGH